MNTFTVEFEANINKPMYYQLYTYIIREIKNGNLKENEKLPSKRTLANHLKISQNTIETAYEMLLTEGYVYSKPRSGFYISKYEALKTKPLPLTKKNCQIDFKEEYKFDFHTSVVDTTAFPYTVWTKITKEVLYDSSELLQHGHRQGDYIFRNTLSKYLHEFRGVSCTPEQIIIGAGMEYIMSLIADILGRKAIFAFENPGYLKIYQILKNKDRKIKLIEVHEDGISLEQLNRSEADIAYITPSHQFPMGATMPIGKRIELLKWANNKEGRYIIEDDYDSEFRFNGKPIPCLQGLDENGKVIYVGTFSRSIAPSIRVAYMVLPEELMRVYYKNFASYSSTVSRIEQHTIQRFIEEGYLSRHLNRMRNLYKKRKEALVEGIKKSELGLKVDIIGANAGLHLLLKVNNGMKQQELLSSAKSVGIKLYGLSDYFIDGKCIYDNIVVAGFSGLTVEQIEQAVDLLNKVW